MGCERSRAAVTEWRDCYQRGDVRSGILLPLPSVALRTSTSELRVPWHRVVAAALAAKPALSVLNHGVKFVSDSAMGTADSPLTVVGHHGARDGVPKTGKQMPQLCDTIYRLPHDQSLRFFRESHLDPVAILMDSHAVFVCPTGFQLHCVATYPAVMTVLELRLLHEWPSSQQKGPAARLTGRGQIVKIPK
jgi:hypothetical protein